MGIFSLVAGIILTYPRLWDVLITRIDGTSLIIYGIVFVFGAFGYYLNSKNMLISRSLQLWGVNSVIGVFGFLGFSFCVNSTGKFISLVVVGMVLFNFLFIFVNALIEIMQKTLSNSKDRLTVIITFFGILISTIALFK